MVFEFIFEISVFFTVEFWTFSASFIKFCISFVISLTMLVFGSNIWTDYIMKLTRRLLECGGKIQVVLMSDSLNK